MADSRTISASMPTDLAEWLREAATTEGVTPSAYVTRVMRDHQIVRSEQLWQEWVAGLTGEDKRLYDEDRAAYMAATDEWDAEVTARAADTDGPCRAAA
jgi:hypothetical protein